jgi:head-tail adaptor
MPPYPYQRVKDPLSLPSGMLRHEIHVQQQLTSQRDAMGGQSPTWTDLYVAMGAIDTLSSKELFQSTQSAQFAAQVSHRITLRWPGEIGITAGMQVSFGAGLSHTAVIQAVENVQQRNRVLYLMVLEIDGSE